VSYEDDGSAGGFVNTEKTGDGIQETGDTGAAHVDGGVGRLGELVEIEVWRRCDLATPFNGTAKRNVELEARPIRPWPDWKLGA
jgi:hypothetical protein